MTEPATAQLTSPAPWVAALRGFLGTPLAEVEHCELCDAEIGAQHAHLIEPKTRRLLCACRGCSLLFDHDDPSRRFRRVPDRAARLHDFALADDVWDALLIPINMAFFCRSSTHKRVLAMYPGPAGATESTLDLAAWGALVDDNPWLDQLECDVEALLVNRVNGAREYYRVPIDRCYALVGTIRTHWHGVSGGQGSREAIQAFFAQLREETDAKVVTHA